MLSKRGAADRVGENLRHAHGQRRRAARAIQQRDFANRMRQIGHRLRLQRVAPAADRCGRGLGASRRRWLPDC